MDEGSIFDLDLPDSDLLALIQKPLTESESYWDNERNLKKVREDNMNLWLPNHYKGKDVFDYQEEYLYQDNRIFTSVETIISIVNSRIPTVDCMPAQDTLVSERIAKDLSKSLYAYSDKYGVLDVFRISGRNLLLKRIGYIKLRFDPTVGKLGEIVTENVAPEDIIVDKDAKLGEIPKFIAQRIGEKTLEDLVAMFPDNEQAILEMGGVQRRDGKGDLVAQKSQMAKKKKIYEVWFYYVKKGEYHSGVAWVDENFQYVLGKIRNPNWNYEDEAGFTGNFLDRPAPPFIPVNYLNDGTSYIDLTSMVEQAAPLQKILDRRGFQIMENAEQAGSGIVFNTAMISKEDVAKLTGSPDERVGVNGNVRDAFTRVAPPPLPSYVMEDKYDARKEIDNIFATHDVTRGEQSGNRTLGQDQMQREQSYTRLDDISRAFERSATLYYRYLVQMMKVYYTEEHYFKLVGEDGQFNYLVMKQDMIEDGIDVMVKAGSMQPINKAKQMENVSILAQQGLVDPLTIYEVLGGGDLPSPAKMLERFMLYKVDPIAYLGKTKDDDFSGEAFMDIQILIRGQMPKMRDEINPTYLKTMNEYMLTGQFESRPDMVKNMFIEHLKMASETAALQMAKFQTQAPTQEDMDSTNQAAVKQAEVEAQVMGGQPQTDVPAEADALSQKADQNMAKQDAKAKKETF